MSKYAEFSTELTEEKHLVTALEAMGYTVECHQEPVNLYGYHGDKRADTANVIVRRQFIGSASNDLGFVRDNPKAPYRAIISNFDRGHFTNAWLGKLKQGYTEARTMAVAKQRGYLFQKREVTDKGEVRLLFAVR